MPSCFEWGLRPWVWIGAAFLAFCLVRQETCVSDKPTCDLVIGPPARHRPRLRSPLSACPVLSASHVFSYLLFITAPGVGRSNIFR